MARRDDVMATLATVRLANTEQIGRLHFSDHLSPAKRASECLSSLAKQKLVEGEIIKFGTPKIWRLTKKGRDQLNVKYAPVPILSRKTNHTLAVTDYYIHLCQTEKPLFFIAEYREQIEDGCKFSPDAFFVWQNRAYFFEMQLTPLSRQQWRNKWEVYERFYSQIDKRAFQKAQRSVKPILTVITKQMKETIGSPDGVEVVIFTPSEGENQSLEGY